jgi:type II secretory pathway pseudopilin PulG
MNQYADSLIKIFPILVAIAGGLWTVQTYFANLEQTSRQEQAAQEKEQHSQLLQAQQPFLEHRWKAYIETSAVVGQLVALDTSEPAWQDARRRFWELYWSELAMVETPTVASAMVDFGRQLTSVTSALNGDQAALKNGVGRLNAAAIAVAHALRDSIQVSWGLSSASSP